MARYGEIWRGMGGDARQEMTAPRRSDTQTHTLTRHSTGLSTRRQPGASAGEAEEERHSDGVAHGRRAPTLTLILTITIALTIAPTLTPLTL